ncbi:MAG: dual specificity protein phosphatase family protein [Parachlamydia sp.]|nr:dual specificity protein phosphatase family protein [Parachlamydia sp.]
MVIVGSAAAEETLTKKVKYEASLSYTLWAGKEWWSKIEPHSLYLGGLPLKNQGHFDKIKELGVTHVISLVEDFELEEGWSHQPVQGSEWMDAGIHVTHIKAIDFCPLTQEQLKEGIETLSSLIAEGHVVYVHCKAGVGRSASIAVGFLMQEHDLTLDEAIAFAKQYRPHINLNAYQQKAIQSYFSQEENDGEEIEVEESFFFNQPLVATEESLGKALSDMLDYVIEGFTYESNQYPSFMADWSPGIHVESTLARRDRYLLNHQGDADAAVKAAVEKNHSIARKWKNIVASHIPFIGAPANYTVTLWHQLREIALIASLYGHPMDEKTKAEILLCLVQGNAMKGPAQTIDLLAKAIAKKILVEAGICCIPGIPLPTHLIFNYLTDNSAKVSTYAIEVFGGENAKPFQNDSR